MTIEVQSVTVTKVPREAVEYLRPHAVRAGHGGSDAAVMRWALLAHEQTVRQQQEEAAAKASQAVA